MQHQEHNAPDTTNRPLSKDVDMVRLHGLHKLHGTVTWKFLCMKLLYDKLTC